MAKQAVNAPALFDRQDAYRGAYAARTQEFTEAGRHTGLASAQEDREKIALVLVDYQHDFVDPTGTLYVPGAQDDVARLLTWFYANAPRITTVYASLDTHIPFQIFYSAWWKNPQTGAHPQPFTAITAGDVTNNTWAPVIEPNWSMKYVQQLQQQARKDLMIWPYHTMEGTLGQMLVAPISEAIAWHSAARNAQPTYIIKGLTVRSEYYGIFGAEIPDPQDPESELNTALLDAVMQHDRVYIAGEAKSHCVLETERQLVQRFSQQPELLKRLYFLRDCTSSVQHPTIDFDTLAESELASMERQGVQMARSTDPIP
ncbi:MAG: cysteine hydrolase family protein [Ktedonobacteraceae bacterium]